MADYISDHVDQAIDRLPQQHRDKTEFAALITALVDQVQEIEDALYALESDRLIGTATGYVLDTLGKLVGQRRDTTSDFAYAIRVNARIPANKGSGVTNQILRVMRIIFYAGTNATITLTQHYPAAFAVVIGGYDVSAARAENAVRFIRLCKAAGVRGVFISSDGAAGSQLYMDGAVTGEDLDGGYFFDARE